MCGRPRPGPGSPTDWGWRREKEQLEEEEEAVTFVEKVGGDRNQLLKSSALRPPRGQGNEALVTLEVRGGTEEVGGEEVGVMLTDSAADEGVVVRTMKGRILTHMSATETSVPTDLLSNEPETGYIFF